MEKLLKIVNQEQQSTLKRGDQEQQSTLKRGDQEQSTLGKIVNAVMNPQKTTPLIQRIDRDVVKSIEGAGPKAYEAIQGVVDEFETNRELIPNPKVNTSTPAAEVLAGGAANTSAPPTAATTAAAAEGGESVGSSDVDNKQAAVERKDLNRKITKIGKESTDAGPEKQPPIDINIDSLSFSGIMESGKAYDDALNDYIKLLEKKDPEELRTKADDARRQDLWLTAAKFFSKMGSAAPSSLGASGFSSILEAAMKSAPESIDEVKKIQKQFREEVALADKLKEDVAKEKVTLEQARELMRLKRWGVGSDLLTARSNLIKSGEFDPQEWTAGIKAMEAFMGKLGIQSGQRRNLMANFSELVQLYPNNIPGVVATVTKNYRSKNPSGGGSTTGGKTGGKTATEVQPRRYNF